MLPSLFGLKKGHFLGPIFLTNRNSVLTTVIVQIMDPHQESVVKKANVLPPVRMAVLAKNGSTTE